MAKYLNASVLNFWRENRAHPDGSVPGYLSIGAACLFPPIDLNVPVQSISAKMPASCSKGRAVFPTIERGGVYVSLKIGQYEMKHSKKKRKGAPGGVINCLQCTDSPIDQILIHDALNDSSVNLAGCIAPGMEKKPPPGQGILESEKAMEEIWKLLGGYSIGKLVTLNVWSNVPGETRTRKTWGKLK